MKFLKLDARFEDARRVARCLVGSEINKHNNLCGVFDEWFFIACEEVRQSCTIQKIELPLDTLKFCPYVAARHQIQVRGLQKGILHFGVIRKIAFAKAGPRFRIDSIEGHAMMFRKSNISINLTPIERGELKGCEIVEVGE